MGAILALLLKLLSFLGLGFLQVAKSSLAGIIAALVWVSTNLTKRAAMFVILRFVLLYGITKCVIFFGNLVAGFTKPSLGKLAQIWEDAGSAGSLLPGVIVNTLNLSYVFQTMLSCFEVFLGCLAFRVLIYEVRFMKQFAGVSVKS